MARRRRNPAGSITVASTQRRLRVPAARVRRLVAFVARRERKHIDHLDVLIVGRRRMASLNARLLSRRGPTDVISLDLGAGPTGGLCAQIVVCADVAIAEARRRGRPAWKELLLYITHGLLHEMGYDDATEARAHRMHRREDQLLKGFGIGPVYAGAEIPNSALLPKIRGYQRAKPARCRQAARRRP